MVTSLKNKSFLKLLDFSSEEIHYMIELSEKLKADKQNGVEKQLLKGKNIALIFEKASTRTRCAFEVAAYDQGAHVTYLGPTGSQIGYKESIKDTARVLGGMYDGIEYRGFGQEVVEQLAQYSGVPVWNGLTNEFHPTQILADMLTIKENINKPLNEVKLCYLGDAKNNMGNSLMVGSAKLGLDFRAAAPKICQPQEELINTCNNIAKETGANIFITDEIAEAVKDADVLYTDVWVSMGEPDSVWKERLELLLPYQVNKKVLEITGNNNVKFMHCLPAFHDLGTKVGKNINDQFGLSAMEVTDEVFESDNSLVFKESSNRMHTIKAVMVATLG